MEEKIECAMNLMAKLVIEELAQDLNKTTDEVFIAFMQSHTAQMLYDDSIKLWWDSPLNIAEMYKKEKNIAN